MLDEELDNLLNDAANQYHPPYNDKDWGKMQVLLDKHLPQKKYRKIPLLFLLLFFILSSTIIIGIIQPWKNKPSTISSSNSGNEKEVTTGAAAIKLNSATNNQNGKIDVTTVSYEKEIQDINVSKKSTGKTLKNNSIITAGNKPASATDAGKSYKLITKNKTIIKVKIPDMDYEQMSDENVDATDMVSANDKKIPLEEKVEAEQSDSINIKKDKPLVTKNGKAYLNKTKSSLISKFAITLSAGADLSYISLNKPGKIEPVYGAGLIYNTGKHFSIGSGLLISKKIYYATPTQYKFTGGGSYPYLEKINADCKVYEIPLNIYYNFNPGKKHNWFVNPGLSSFIMKKETYDYYYKNPWGQTYSYEKIIKNENKHFFSVLTLSAGYQYNFSKHLSLLATPYLKIPLAGIGSGKVKLNSTGLLFTAALKPFSKQKNKK
jgi:hypothetical protein